MCVFDVLIVNTKIQNFLQIQPFKPKNDTKMWFRTEKQRKAKIYKLLIMNNIAKSQNNALETLKCYQSFT